MLFTLAASTQQKIGFWIAVALVVGWLLYLFAATRTKGEAPGSEIELAPNRRPYFDDEAMEGPRLVRAQMWAVILLGIIAIGLPVYWLREPGRQAGAERGFDNRAVHRGESLFKPANDPSHGAHFGCQDCHGPKGVGGVAPYTITDALGGTRIVQWAAPPLDTALLRFNKEEVRRILVYGRPNTPMPAWGVEGGGPMNDQQVDDLVAYIESITLKGDAAKRRTEEELATARKTSGGLFDEGRALFELHCARCHTKGWSIGEPQTAGGGAFGPNLTGGVTVRQFPSFEDHVEFIVEGSDFEEGYGTRGVGSGRMPGFGEREGEDGLVPGQLTREQIIKIVEYERSL